MPYTFEPKQKYAKLCTRNSRISTISAEVLCAAIRRKPLSRAKRLLGDLAAERRSLGSKHYTKTAREMLLLLESCEKNAEFLGLDSERLMVHASAHMGSAFRRRRRKAAFGSKMKTTHVEIFLIERGAHKTQATKGQKAEPRAEKKLAKRMEEMKSAGEELKEDVKELKESVGQLKGTRKIGDAQTGAPSDDTKAESDIVKAETKAKPNNAK